MYSPRAPTRQGKESVTFAGKLTAREAGLGQIDERRPRAESPEGPNRGGEKGGPGPRQKVGLPGEGGVPAGGALGGLAAARQEPGGAARGNPGRGRSLGRWDGEE